MINQFLLLVKCLCPIFLNKANLLVVALILMGGGSGLHAQSQRVALNWDIHMSRSGGSPAAPGDKEPGQDQVYLLLLDHSGSMMTREGAANRTRWDLLKASLTKTITDLPRGAEVRLTVFDSRFQVLTGNSLYKISDLSSRARLIKMINDYPAPAGLTYLYDAIGDACETAIAFVNAGKQVTLVVFSDGKDETSQKYCALETEVRTGPLKRNRILLGKEFGAFFKDNCFQGYVLNLGSSRADGYGLPFISVPSLTFDEFCFVKFSPQQVTLSELRSQDVVNVPLRCDFVISADAWKELEQKPFLMMFSSGSLLEKKVVEIKQGKVSVRMEVDRSKLSKEQMTGTLSFSTWPEVKGIKILPPSKPIEVVIPQAGEVMLSDIRPVSGICVKIGEPVKFSVVADPKGSKVKWDFGSPNVADSDSASMMREFKVPGVYPYTVVGEFAGLESAKKRGTIEVVDFWAKINPPSKNAIIGVPYEVSCQGGGPYERFEWSFDNEPYLLFGDGKREASAKAVYTFKKSGRHTIRVKAFSSKVSPVESDLLTVVCDPQPIVFIESPIVGEVHLAKTPVEMKARTEGGIQSVQWVVKDMATGAEEKFETPVAPDGNAIGKYAFPKKGEYGVSVFGTVKETTVTRSVAPILAKSPDVKVDIQEPVQNQRLETEVEHKLVVKCMGDLKEVEWFEIHEDGTRAEIGRSSVDAGGTAALAKSFSSADDDRLISFVAVGKDEAGDLIESAPVQVAIYTLCNIEIKQPANYAAYPFGQQIAFEAAVKSRDPKLRVEWHWMDGDKRIEMPDGKSVAHKFTQREGVDETLIPVYAEVVIGTRRIKSEPRFIKIYCPALEPRIKLTMTNGIEVAEYGLNEPISFNLDYKGANLPDVLWSFGDGTQTAGCATVSHSYTNYGPKVVFAVVTCKLCGSKEDAEQRIEIVRRAPKAEFVIKRGAKVVSGNANLGSMLQLECHSTGDVARREWRCNGVLLPETGKRITVSCDKRGVHEYTLAVYDIDGAVSPWEPDKQSIRVYNLWIILAISLVALILYGILLWYYSGDEPSVWRIAGYRTDKWGATIKDIRFTVPVKLKPYWNTMHNEATIPMHRIFPLAKHFREGQGQEDTVIVASYGGLPQVRLSAGKVVCLEMIDSNIIYRLTDNRLETRDNNDNYKRIWLKVDTKRAGIYFVLRKFALFVFVLGCALLLCKIFGM